MKKIIYLAILACTQAFAQSPSHYAIIVDAGSTGSRAHLFEYQMKGNMPVIDEIFSEKISPGLSSFAGNPQDAGPALKKLLDDTNQTLAARNIDPKEVEISIMATAGMRLLPEDKQQAIYQSITDYIKANYTFSPNEIGTITGKMEALYGWLDVNYLSHTFNTKPYETIGSLDMGGASTEIAYQTQDMTDPDDETTLVIRDNKYTVFSKSYLGLGQDQALAKIQGNEAVSACYPTGYALPSNTIGTFNYAVCRNVYQTSIINPYNISANLPDKGNQKFIAYSGYYYVFQFLDALNSSDQSSFDKKVENTCTQSWDQMKQNHSSVPEKYLSTYCANAAYMSDLLYNNYQFSNGQLSVPGKIQGKDVDWPLGALFYRLVK